MGFTYFIASKKFNILNYGTKTRLLLGFTIDLHEKLCSYVHSWVSFVSVCSESDLAASIR